MARARPRPYNPILNSHDSNTSNTRETIATPANGKRIRVIEIVVIQEASSGRRNYELYFGTGTDITTNKDKAIDVLDIPDEGQDSTREYERGEGPRGERNEVLSGRWNGTAPSNVHKVQVKYILES